MDVLLAGTFLASESSGFPPEDFACNGVRVVEAVDLARALFKSLYPRGNIVHTITFKTCRVSGSVGSAQVASIMALTNAPDTGQLEIRCGGPGEELQSVFFASAVVQQIPGTTTGVATNLLWTILASGPSTTADPNLLVDPDAPNSMRGKIPIPIGADTVPVEFSSALNNPVVSSLSVEIPPGGDRIGIAGVQSVSNNGFTGLLSAPVPGAGYYLHFQANQHA